MAEFLLEAYARDVAASNLDTRRMEASANRRRNAGMQIRLLRTIFLPEDETSLVLFDAPSAEDVVTIVSDAGLPIERIAIAVLTPGEESP